MKTLLLKLRSRAGCIWRCGLIRRTTAFRWDVDASLGEFSFRLFSLCLCASLVLGCLSGAPVAHAQNIVGPGYTRLQQTPGMPWQLAGDWKFNSTSTATAGFD